MEAKCAYDSAGNRTQGTGEDGIDQTYTYNNANRLSTAKVNTSLVGTYTYNALGQRVSKTYADNTKELFHYNEAGQLLAVTNASGTTLREYIYNGNTLVGYINAGVLVYVHNDHHNTPQVVTAQNQSVVWMADYEPFGKAKLNGANNINFVARFPGQYLDSETGIYYNYFRDYDPSIGRYIESDPIGLNGGINTYAYVGGNPILYIDPFGNSKVQGQSSIGGSDSAVSGITKNSTKAELDAAIKRAQDIVNDPNASAARKNYLRGWIKVAKRGFSKAVCPPFMEDVLLDVSRTQCLQGDMEACATFQLLGGTIINPYEA